MIVGPGTITTLLIFFGQADSTGRDVAVAVALAVVLAAMTAVLYFAAEFDGREVLALSQLDGFRRADPQLYDGIAALARAVGQAS